MKNTGQVWKNLSKIFSNVIVLKNVNILNKTFGYEILGLLHKKQNKKKLLKIFTLPMKILSSSVT